MNFNHLYIGINILIVVFALAFFSGWSVVAGILAALNAYGQYQIIKNSGGN